MDEQTPQGLPKGWRLVNYGTCKSCHAQVLWAVHEVTKKRAPFDPEGTSHFATCPDADQHRKPRH